MSRSILPIQNLDQIGLVKDTPAIALGPNAWSDCLNVRFKNGSAQKISGELELVDQATLDAANSGQGVGDIIHMAWWSNPNVAPSGYFIIVGRSGSFDTVYLIDPITKEVSTIGIRVRSENADWQHAFFQGGYAVVLNNGTARPWYMLDETGNTTMGNITAYELPGWDSYNTVEESVNDSYNSQINFPDFGLGRLVDFTVEEVIVDVLAEDGTRKFNNVHTSNGTIKQSTLSTDIATNSTLLSIAIAAGGSGGDAFADFLEDGDQVIVRIRSLDTVQVRAGVIRAWNDKLVAGDLVELVAPKITNVVIGASDTTLTFTGNHGLTLNDAIAITAPLPRVVTFKSVTANTITINEVLSAADYSNTKYTIVRGGKPVRNQAGVVRISDAAAPGSIPSNWNPYGVGVSTAEEFQLSTTGIIQDIVELQGNLMVYTNNTVHSITETGNQFAPYVSRVITTSYGALGKDCVKEFNGVHIVVGQDDIYKFSGHPASIESIAKGRVQEYLYNSIHPDHVDDTVIIANKPEHELWICYFTDANRLIRESLIWNYLQNTWTRRVITPFESVVEAPTLAWDSVNKVLLSQIDNSRLRPVMASVDSIFATDYEFVYKAASGASFNSYIERTEAPMTPEFDVENINSCALLVDKDDGISTPFDIQLQFAATDAPGNKPNFNNVTKIPFTIKEDYKIDVRVNGRFLHMRVSDDGLSDRAWRVVGMQLDVGKGGRR